MYCVEKNKKLNIKNQMNTIIKKMSNFFNQAETLVLFFLFLLQKKNFFLVLAICAMVISSFFTKEFNLEFKWAHFPPATFELLFTLVVVKAGSLGLSCIDCIEIVSKESKKVREL